jgi:uncharacterized protein (TIGR00156 family)
MWRTYKHKEKKMKKISMLAVLTLLPVYGSMAANNMNKNTNTQPTYWSVTEVMALPDNSPVVMRGRITKNMGGNMYLFEDSSGNVMLEIDEEDWNGNTVRVNDIVTVYGNVDKGVNYTEIDVESVEK